MSEEKNHKMPEGDRRERVDTPVITDTVTTEAVSVSTVKRARKRKTPP